MTVGELRSEPWHASKRRVLIDVRLTPRAARDEVDGVEAGPQGPVLKARVRAVPDKGEANAALVRLIADWLGIPKRDVMLAAGGKSRSKTIEIAGEPAAIVARLRERLGPAKP